MPGGFNEDEDPLAPAEATTPLASSRPLQGMGLVGALLAPWWMERTRGSGTVGTNRGVTHGLEQVAPERCQQSGWGAAWVPGAVAVGRRARRDSGFSPPSSGLAVGGVRPLLPHLGSQVGLWYAPEGPAGFLSVRVVRVLQGKLVMPVIFAESDLLEDLRELVFAVVGVLQ